MKIETFGWLSCLDPDPGLRNEHRSWPPEHVLSIFFKFVLWRSQVLINFLLSLIQTFLFCNKPDKFFDQKNLIISKLFYNNNLSIYDFAFLDRKKYVWKEKPLNDLKYIDCHIFTKTCKPICDFLSNLFLGSYECVSAGIENMSHLLCSRISKLFDPQIQIVRKFASVSRQHAAYDLFLRSSLYKVTVC